MPKRRETTAKLGRGYAAAQVRSATFNDDDRTVEVVFTTEHPVRRRSWEDGPFNEVLVCDAKSVRLGRMNNGAPVLDSHDGFSLGSVIGTVVPGSARFKDGQGICQLRFSSRPEVAGIVQDIRDGILSSVSVGYRIHKFEKDEGDREEIPTLRATDWEPLEVSVVAIPADPDAKFRSNEREEELFDVVVVRNDVEETITSETNEEIAEMHPKRKAVTESSGAALEGMARLYDLARKDGESDDALRARVLEKVDAEISAEAARSQTQAETRREPAPVTPAPQPATPPATQEDTQAVAARAVEQERARANSIRELATRFRMDDASMNAALTSGMSVEAYRNQIWDAMAERTATNPTFPVVETRGLQDEVSTRREAVENALLHRTDPQNFALSDAGRQYRGMTLIEIAGDLLESRGETVRGLSRVDVAQRALHTTSDFPIILEGVINRVMMQGYQREAQTFQAFCRRSTASDFRDQHRIQVGEVGDLTKLNEHGEYTSTTLSEGREKYRIATYGKKIGITRQVLINDDLGIFTNLAGKFGNAVSRLESKVVWDIILSNPVMADGNALFSAAHNNLASGGAVAVLSIAAMNAGRLAMSKHKDIDGRERIVVAPSFLLYAPENSMTVAQMFGQWQPATEGNVKPSWVSSLTPIEEYRLSDLQNGASWFLVANPAQIDTIEYAYLEGNEAPYTESRTGFDIDGMEVKIRHDFGAAPIDYRGFYKNPGT